MRRKEREITEPSKIKEIISSCSCCRLGLIDDGHVYIVPLNFGYSEENDTYTFYFHSAKEGRKISLMKNNSYAAFEMDTNHSLKEGNSACSHSAYFQSVIGEGKISFIEDMEEKRDALQAIMHHNTGKADWDFPEKMIDAVCVFRLDVQELSCKENM